MKPPQPNTDDGAERARAVAGLEALRWAVSRGAAAHVVAGVRARQRRRRLRLGVLAAGLIVLAGLSQQHFTRPAAAPAPDQGRSSVVVAPVTRVLPDGSRVQLREGARVDVEFTPERRRVALWTSEAHFEVTKDAARPFIVAAGGIEVRAVGTAFSVQVGPRAVEVLVTEGRVAVEKAAPASAAPAGASVVVDAGNRVVVEIAPVPAGTLPVPVLPVSALEQDQRLAWRVPRLEFSGTRLGEAVAMFNRHSRERLELDPALAHLQLSGTLRADDVDSLLLLLRNEFEIEVTRLPGGGIRLHRR
ncbi:MAG: FecR domain-containing protein [Opitutaceae bacterium]|nr:FecR domain-containing protein [Opitutaceae bacterium]